MKIFEYMFSQSSGKNINVFKTQMEWHEEAMYYHTHMYLSNRTNQVQIII